MREYTLMMPSLSSHETLLPLPEERITHSCRDPSLSLRRLSRRRRRRRRCSMITLTGIVVILQLVLFRGQEQVIMTTAALQATTTRITTTTKSATTSSTSTLRIFRHRKRSTGGLLQNTYHTPHSFTATESPSSTSTASWNKNITPHTVRTTLYSIRGGGNAEDTRRTTKNNNDSLSTTTKRRRRSIVFPIQRHEYPKFTCMSTMMFLFIYVFTTVRDTKDSLVVSNCGAESIPFLKLYGVMPCAMLLIVGYSKMSNVFGTEHKDWLFYTTLVPFFIFYTLFAYVLYPLRDIIHFPSIDIGSFSSGSNTMRAVLSLVKYWSFSLYFIISELWASAGIPLLFWTCANDVISDLNQAKRFYPLFAILGNIAPIVSGKLMSAAVSLQKTNDDVGFGQTLQILAFIKLMACTGIVLLYRTVYRMSDAEQQVVSSPNDNIQSNKKKNKKKPTLRESLIELSQSSELQSMATMVICYNACIELTEVLWKSLLKQTYPNKSEYMKFMSNFSQLVGYSAFVLQLCASTIITALGWRWSALLTPLSMGLLAIPFFIMVGINQSGTSGSGSTNALLIGTIQNVVSKITKYSLFDPCKEMAYIPLGPEAKVKGKAAVDVLGSRLGRSIGSASQQMLVLLSVGGGTILNCAPTIGVLYMSAIIIWCQAVLKLSTLFSVVVSDETEEENTAGKKPTTKLPKKR